MDPKLWDHSYIRIPQQEPQFVETQTETLFGCYLAWDDKDAAGCWVGAMARFSSMGPYLQLRETWSWLPRGSNAAPLRAYINCNR